MKIVIIGRIDSSWYKRVSCNGTKSYVDSQSFLTITIQPETIHDSNKGVK